MESNSSQRLLSVVDLLILFLAFFLSNLRALVFFSLFPDPQVFPGLAWSEIILWAICSCLPIYMLLRIGRLEDLWALWRRNWPLALFVFLALISIFWSLDFYTSLFRALELLLATMVASYLGMRFRPRQLSMWLFWFGAILLVLSLVLVSALPAAGRMFQDPYDGAWRGIYWHKNHLGSVIALVNSVFGIRMIIALEKQRRGAILDEAFYLLSLLVLYFSNSATGYILAVLLHFFVVCVWIWLKVSHYLQRWHYYILGGISVTGMALVLSNLDIVFGLFNRSPTMTGRVDLWVYLLRSVIPQRLWWGHGFGSLWTIEAFRIATEQQIGWGFQPVIADNGYLDILLHMGLAGFLIFLSVLVLTAIRCFRHALSQGSLTGFLPLLIIFYAFWANIALSLFAETEVFIWFLVVIALFMTSSDVDQLTLHSGGVDGWFHQALKQDQNDAIYNQLLWIIFGDEHQSKSFVSQSSQNRGQP